jgi:hypothetical protein
MIAGSRSDDQQLYELCKVILAESNAEADHHVFIPAASTPLHTAGVSVRDRLPEPNLHIFLIDTPPLTATNGHRGLLLAEELAPLTDIQEEALGHTQNSLRMLTRMTSAMTHLAVGWRVPRVPNLKGRCAVARRAGNPRDSVAGGREATPSQFIANSQFRSRRERASVDEFTGEPCKFASRGGPIAVRGYPQVRERRSANRREGARNGAHAEPGGRRGII